MNVLTAILRGIVDFVRRNPLLTLLILLLAFGAPAVLKGIALFLLYAMIGVVVIILILVVWVQWNMRKVRRNMQGEGYDAASARDRKRREGEVRVHRTASAPEKRVSQDVGDYVDFEETKEPPENK